MGDLTVREKFESFCFGGLIMLVLFFASYGVAMMSEGEEYRIGECLAVDNPPWIRSGVVLKITDKDRDRYLLQVADQYGLSPDSLTVKHTSGNEFEILFYGQQPVAERIMYVFKKVPCSQ
jgi:hypothetical protein